jgi:hypothetical protein
MPTRQCPVYRKGTNKSHFEIMKKQRINRGKTQQPQICKRCLKPILKGEKRHKGSRSRYHEICFLSTLIGDDD